MCAEAGTDNDVKTECSKFGTDQLPGKQTSERQAIKQLYRQKQERHVDWNIERERNGRDLYLEMDWQAN